MSTTPLLPIRGSLLAHAPFDIRLKPESLPDKDSSVIIGAMLPRLDKRERYATLYHMGRDIFERYFDIVPAGTDLLGLELDVEALWERIRQEARAGFL